MDTVNSPGLSSPAGHDWTEDIADSDHVRFFRSTDWAASYLGALDSWSIALRNYTYQVLSDSRPAVVYWGPGKVAIYNEAFVPLAGKAHPTLMGTRFQDGFPEIWSNIQPVFHQAEVTRKAVDVIELSLMVERNDFVEETYFTGNFNPLRGDSGGVEGFYNALTEVTRQKLDDRRMDMLDSISVLPEKHSFETIGTHIINCLETNAFDVPFALLYHVNNPSTPTSFPSPIPASALKVDNIDFLKSGQLTLHGSIGVPKGHRFLAHQYGIDSDDGLFPLLRDTTSNPNTIPLGNQFAGIEWAGFGEPSTHISVIPLSNTGQLYGYLVVGTNPRRPIDADHDHFVRAIATQVSATIAFVVHTESLTRQQRSLENKLAASERHIRYMAEHLDIGLEHLTLDGNVIWANDHYYKLIGNKPTPEFGQMTLPFKDSVLEEDQPSIHKAWKAVVHGVKAHTMELRMKKLFHPPSGPPVPATVLLSAFPYLEDGEIKSIMACMTEVSRLKWAEAWQARAAQEAQEAKRQQSEFTDTISHEIRNPLSAIFHLADSISTSSLELSQGQGARSMEDCLHVLRENAEAAKTILVCARHQKRIVDDVLTLSKMDFMLMTLTPTAVQPPDLVNGALNILDADLSAADIKLQVRPNASMHTLDVDWVLCDPLRVTQILINLVSNAVKFTKQESRRQITLEYGASLSNPKEVLSPNISWASSKREHQDVTIGEEWGTEEQIYLTFSISDTGPGMTAEERRLLFNRFQQSSPKTSIKYGGTGLGLFISHSLAEKQSGSIGLSSEPGQGSTFAFFIKVRRSLAPSTPSVSELSHQLESELVIQTPEDAALVIPPLDVSVKQGPKSSTDVTYHVLLVEDNLVNQRILQRQLVKAGCVVQVANHGLEALEILRSTELWEGKSGSGTRLDVILMDLEMPVMDGLTASREIRSLEREGRMTGHVEIIAISANARQEQVDDALAAGIDGVMPKPFLVSDLLKTMKERLGR